MKLCESCSAPLIKRGYECPSQFARRRSCSTLCARRLMSLKHRAGSPKKVESRACPICSTSFEQKRVGQEMCSRKCARRKAVACVSAKRANGSGWLIVDTETERPYIDRLYPSEAVANRERAELLAGYPAGHEWRRRLVVRERVVGVVDGKEAA